MASNKYEEIALAAIKLFEQKGYHATSVQDIADEVGLQKGSLYHCIASKEELLVKIAHQSISGFNRRLETILHTDQSSQQKLQSAVEAHLSVVTANLQMTTVLLREAFSLRAEQGQAIADLSDQYLNLWTAIIKQGIERNEFKSDINPRITALAILGACNWTYRWYQPGRMLPEEISQIFGGLFLTGLSSE